MKKTMVAAACFLFLLTGGIRAEQGKPDEMSAGGTGDDWERKTREFQEQQKNEAKEYYQKQKEENEKFRADLNTQDLTPEEKTRAWKKQREGQYQQNKNFREQRHQENLNFLRGRLADNKRLTDAQKSELIIRFESQYQEDTSLSDKQHAENVAFFEKIANDPNLTQEQKIKAINDHMHNSGVSP